MTKVTNKKSQFSEIWRKFKRNKLAVVGLVLLVCVLLMAVFADVIADYDLQVIFQNRRSRRVAPCAEFWFGTDALGRDIFARVVHGLRRTY